MIDILLFSANCIFIKKQYKVLHQYTPTLLKPNPRCDKAMADFSTCFPVSGGISNSSFSQLAVEWLRGIKKSQVLHKTKEQSFYDDDALIIAENGERFCLKSVANADVTAIGLQHEIPDGDGHIWRTECVLTRSSFGAWVRVRSQCALVDANADIIQPTKPYLIKMMLRNGWVIDDMHHEIREDVHELRDSNLNLAASIILGNEQTALPFIYVTLDENKKPLVSPQRLAFDLGGVAHVYLEPSRIFSLNLMNIVEQKNPYAGTIAVCVPRKGVIRKFYRRTSNDSYQQILSAIQLTIAQYNSSLSRDHAYDWQTLQEVQGRILRQEMENRLKTGSSNASADELKSYITAFDQEIEAKNERIQLLESNLQEALSELSLKDAPDNNLVARYVLEAINPQIYEGEASDRLRKLIEICLNDEIKQTTLSKREHYILEQLYSRSCYSGGANTLCNEIKAAGKDTKEMPSRIGLILSRIGFNKSEEGKHLKYTPNSDLGGIGVEILPKTPSDYRAGRNKASDIIDNLSIKGLHKK
jgi:hypothetical protein